MYKYLYELISFFKNKITGYTIDDYEEENTIMILFENKQDKFIVIIEKNTDKIIVDNVEFDLTKDSVASRINKVYKAVISRIDKSLLK